MQDSLLTLHEVADLTGYGADTLRVLANKGDIPAKRLGRDWFVNQSDIKWIEARRIKNAHRIGKVKPLFKEEDEEK